MNVNPGLKKAIIELLQAQPDTRLVHEKGGLAKLIYDMLPNAPWKPAPGNMNVIVTALEQLHEQGRIRLDRKGRKLYEVAHQQRHDGPAGVIATPSEVDPDAAFEVELVVESEPPTVEQLIDLVRELGPHDVARELLRIVVQVARTPQQDPAELDALRRKVQEADREVKRLTDRLAATEKAAHGDAAELRRVKADEEDLRKGNLELTELLAVAEAERDDWKRRCTEATLIAAQYRRDYTDTLVDCAENMPATTLDDILRQASGN